MKMRTAFSARKVMGECGLRLLKEDEAEEGYRIIETIASVESGRFYIGRVVEVAGGPLVDKLLIKESATLDAEAMQTAIACDVLRAGGIFERYSIQARTPPIGTIREWICDLRANFQDKKVALAVEP